MMKQLKFSVLDLVLMNCIAVISLRWTATAAAVGPSSLALWILAILLFFIPEAFAVRKLSENYSGQGGLYQWTVQAFGEKQGFYCGWCYWVNNIIYFPGLLLFICSNFAYGLHWLNPAWNFENNKVFIILLTLLCLWAVTVFSIFGLSLGKKIQNFGSLGNWVPLLLISAIGIYVFSTKGSQTPITFKSLLPRLSTTDDFSLFSNLCFALAGLELLSFFGGEIKTESGVFKKGLGLSSLSIAFVYVIATFGILVMIPYQKITALNGIVTPLESFGIGGITAFFIAIAGLTGLFTWFHGAARIPYIAGVHKFLPNSFSELHPKYETPFRTIIFQGFIATLFTVFATAGSSALETIYKVLVDMCLILYFIPYLYLFICYFKLETSRSFSHRVFAITGFITTAFGIVMSLLPYWTGNDTVGLVKVLGGTVFILLLGGIIFKWNSIRENKKECLVNLV